MKSLQQWQSVLKYSILPETVISIISSTSMLARGWQRHILMAASVGTCRSLKTVSKCFLRLSTSLPGLLFA